MAPSCAGEQLILFLETFLKFAFLLSGKADSFNFWKRRNRTGKAGGRVLKAFFELGRRDISPCGREGGSSPVALGCGLLLLSVVVSILFYFCWNESSVLNVEWPPEIGAVFKHVHWGKHAVHFAGIAAWCNLCMDIFILGPKIGH